MKYIPMQSLLRNYLPSDYIDSYSKDVTCQEAITPEEFFNMAFKQFPRWVSWLLKLRNVLVKPLGLDTKSRFSDFVRDKNDNEIICGMPDKHLNFNVSLWCGEYKNKRQELRITTIVKYNNLLGRVYFFVIRPFHCIIVISILKHISLIIRK